AGQHRPDLHAIHAGLDDALRAVLIDLLMRLHDDLAGHRIADILRGETPEDAVLQRLDDLAAFNERADHDAVGRFAIRLGDDHVLRDVDQAPREISRVRGLQRGVGQTFAGAVRRNEVLQHGQTLAEIRGDRRLDDLARRLGHQAAHAAELPDLLRAAARARIGHHEDRVEGRIGHAALAAGAQLLHHLTGDLLGDVRPDVDHLVVALAVGDETLAVLLLDLVDLFLRLRDQLFLLRRDVHVVDADRGTPARGVEEPDVLDLIQQDDGLLV